MARRTTNPHSAVRMRRIARVGRDILVGSAFGTMIVLARTWGSVSARIASLQERGVPIET